MFRAFAAATIAALVAGPAMGDYTITQGTGANTYPGMSLNFDEDGGPMGVIDPAAFLESHGLTIQAGDGVPQVGNWDVDHGAGWGLGEGNSFFGNFGVFMTFDTDVTELSVQIWDPSGEPTPFGGGLGVYLFNDGVEVGSVFITPAWGGLGEPWFDIATTDGSVFDEVRFAGFGFSPTTYADNISWNPVVTECPGDFDGSGDIGFSDLLDVLVNFGPCDGCPQDINGNGTVDFDDLLVVLSSWGPCP